MAEALDDVFDGAGKAAGMEIWRIEDFNVVPVPKSDIGKFYSGDSYIVLRTTVVKSGALKYDLHFWLGSETTQDEAGAAAIKTVELDQALGDKAVQYREVQGQETDLFLSYFKPCIVPLPGGVKSGFRKVVAEEFVPKLYLIKGTRVAARVTEVPVSRESLNQDDIFILDTKDKIYQFNGESSNIGERGKAMEVVAQLKDTNHDGDADLVQIEGAEPAGDGEAEDFWNLLGGHGAVAPKAPEQETSEAKLFVISVDGLQEVAGDPSTMDKSVLDTKCIYMLQTGKGTFAWVGRHTSLQQRKKAVAELEKSVTSKNGKLTRVVEGAESFAFKSFFENWPVDDDEE